MLIDAGAGRDVLRQLGDIVPWYDRSIDVVIATHPDHDHIGGFPEVFDRYRVSYVFRSSVEDDGNDALAFSDALAREKADGAVEVIARRGQVIDLGGGAFVEILFPDRSVPRVETNTGSIVARVVYGSTAVLLSGDAPRGVEEYLVALDGAALKAQILKAGHHGSETSSAQSFVGFTAPEYVVFSRGCDNRYGHPAPEVVERFRAFGIPTLDTCEKGTITFESDGHSVRQW